MTDDRFGALGTALAVSVAGLIAGGMLTLLAGAAVRVLGLRVGITALVVVSLVLTQGVAFGGVALAYLRLRGLGTGFVPVRLPSARGLAWVGAGYVLSLGGAMAGAALVMASNVEAAPNRLAEFAVDDPELLLVLVPLSFLLIGPGEELLFRGIVQGTLREAFGPVGAVTIAAAIFAGIHYLALSGGGAARLVTVGVLFFPAVVFGAAYERTRNIAVPALIHAAYNATLFVLGYVALRFGPAAPT